MSRGGVVDYANAGYEEDRPEVCELHGCIMHWCECWQCGATGWYGHDCGEDCCMCLDPEDNQRCDVCRGKSGWWRCYECAPEDGADGEEPKA